MAKWIRKRKENAINNFIKLIEWEKENNNIEIK